MPREESTRADRADRDTPRRDEPRDGERPARPSRERRPPARRSRGGSFYRWALAPLAAFVVLTALILASGTPSAGDLMRDASASFGQVKRGDFSFSISITPKGSATAQTSSIRLSGPFELESGKSLPLAHIKYAVTSGSRSQVVEILTTGDKAYTIVGGQAYEMPASTTDQLKKATKQLSAGGAKNSKPGLSGLKLNFDRWLVKPQVGAGSEIDGTPTWRTRAGVDIVAALKDLVVSAGALGGVTGAKVPRLTAADIAQLKSSFKNAQVEVFVGRYDHIVRKIELTMDFNTPAQYASATGGISGGRLDLVIGINKPNQPVDVKPPSNPLPFKALQSLSQGGQTGTALDDGLGR